MKYAIIVLALLGLTACEYDIDPVDVRRAEELCAPNKGVDRLYATGDRSVGVWCRNGARIYSHQFNH